MFDDLFEMMRPAPSTAFRKYDARPKLNSEVQEKAYLLWRLHRFLVLFWGRRTGKTTLEQHVMIETATTHAACAVAFVGPTIDQAIKLVWEELVEWSKEVGGVANHGRHEIRFPNRSIIYLLGSETKKQIDRIRGLKNLQLLVWDEQQSVNSELAIYALASVIMPMLADRRGKLMLSGTGGPERGHWYNLVTHGNTSGPTEKADFAVSRGPTMADNPLIGERFEEELGNVCRLKGVGPNDPYILREYGVPGQGIRFTTDSERSPFKGIPLVEVPELAAWQGWTFVIGGDVGSVDKSAGSVGALHPHYPGAVMFECIEQKTPASTDQIEFFRGLIAKYQPNSVGPVMVALDPGGGGKGVIVDLGRLGGFWEAGAAEKWDKGINVRLMAGDVKTGWLKMTPRCKLAKDALETLEWDPVHPHKLLGHAPDVADSSIYLWRLLRKLFDSIYIGPMPEANPISPDIQRFLEQEEAEEQLLEDLGFN